MNKHFILLTALLGTLSGSVGAQRPSRTADELYTEGKQLYLRGNYAAAEQTLEQFSSPCRPLMPLTVHASQRPNI